MKITLPEIKARLREIRAIWAECRETGRELEPEQSKALSQEHHELLVLSFTFMPDDRVPCEWLRAEFGPEFGVYRSTGYDLYKFYRRELFNYQGATGLLLKWKD